MVLNSHTFLEDNELKKGKSDISSSMNENRKTHTNMKINGGKTNSTNSKIDTSNKTLATTKTTTPLEIIKEEKEAGGLDRPKLTFLNDIKPNNAKTLSKTNDIKPSNVKTSTQSNLPPKPSNVKTSTQSNL